MSSFFPSRTVAIYMGRMFLVRTFGLLAAAGKTRERRDPTYRQI